MSLRILEILIPEQRRDDVNALLDDAKTIARWEQPAGNNSLLIRVLLDSRNTESVMDDLESALSAGAGSAESNDDGGDAGQSTFRVVLLPVEATVPAPDASEQESDNRKGDGPAKQGHRISREELRSDLEGGTKLSPVQLATVVLSTIVAAVGLLQDNVAVVIGAMVIAPLLTPNMALALGTTLGDLTWARRSLIVNVVSVSLVFAIAIPIGAFVSLDELPGEIARRTDVGLADILVALAAGAAGALAFTTGVPAGLVGVMVAVALLPPTVVVGVLIGSGRIDGAIGALLLLATNVICVNLAAVVTFLAQGVRPRTWYEADAARRATRIAMMLWIGLLIVLGVLIYFTRPHETGLDNPFEEYLPESSESTWLFLLHENDAGIDRLRG